MLVSKRCIIVIASQLGALSFFGLANTFTCYNEATWILYTTLLLDKNSAKICQAE